MPRVASMRHGTNTNESSHLHEAFYNDGCCSVLQCVVVCCSVLQCVAQCCSVLQCVRFLHSWAAKMNHSSCGIKEAWHTHK